MFFKILSNRFSQNIIFLYKRCEQIEIELDWYNAKAIDSEIKQVKQDEQT